MYTYIYILYKCINMYTYKHAHNYAYRHICINRERERERERKSNVSIYLSLLFGISHSFSLCIYINPRIHKPMYTHTCVNL